MSRATHDLPAPTASAVALWMKQLSREQLHDEVWQEVNHRLNGLTRAARIFAQQEYTFEEQEAFFDGLTFTLKTLLHFADIEQLAELLERGLAEVQQENSHTLPAAPDNTPNQV